MSPGSLCSPQNGTMMHSPEVPTLPGALRSKGDDQNGLCNTGTKENFSQHSQKRETPPPPSKAQNSLAPNPLLVPLFKATLSHALHPPARKRGRPGFT